jgi:hypothetical protein
VSKKDRMMARNDAREFGTYVKWIAGSGGRQEVNRVDDCHRDNVFLGAEVEIIDSGNDLLSQRRRIHVRGLHLAKRHRSVRFNGQAQDQQ